MSENRIKATKQSAFIFGEGLIQGNFEFSFKIGKTVGTTIIGIIDSSLPNSPHLFDFRNRKYLYESTGHAHTGESRMHKLKELKENDEIKVLGNLKQGKIIWKINSSQQLSCCSQLLQNQSIKWCLFLYLSFQNSLQMISAIPSFQIAIIDFALNIFEWDEDILHDVFQMAKWDQQSLETILF